MAQARLLEIIEMLRSRDKVVRKQAAIRLKALAENGLTAGECQLAFKAATEDWGHLKKIDMSRVLVVAAILSPQFPSPAIIAEFAPRFSAAALYDGIEFLTSQHSATSAAAYLSIVEQHLSLALEADVPVAGFAASAQAVEVLFPRLFNYTQYPQFKRRIHELALAACEKGTFPQAALTKLALSALETFRPLRARMRPMERSGDDDWIWVEEYTDYRWQAALLLDLMGYLPGTEIVAELQAALESADPQVKCFGAVGLLRHGQDVPVTALESVAASAEMRNWFHFALTSLGRTEFFPPRFATHEAFAQSNMVSWLAFPTELARTPHEIELMATFPGATSDQRYYLFRFRTHEYDGWMAGLSGPFSVGASPAPAEGKATWSSFTAWDKKTPREHFAELTEIRQHPE